MHLSQRSLFIGLQPSDQGMLQASFKGRIDDVQIYNRILTGHEIASLYDSSAYGICPQFYGPGIRKVDQGWELSVLSGIEQTIQIQRATELKPGSDWTTVTVLPSALGRRSYIDTETDIVGQRFYRLVSP